MEDVLSWRLGGKSLVRTEIGKSHHVYAGQHYLSIRSHCHDKHHTSVAEGLLSLEFFRGKSLVRTESASLITSTPSSIICRFVVTVTTSTTQFGSRGLLSLEFFRGKSPVRTEIGKSHQVDAVQHRLFDSNQRRWSIPGLSKIKTIKSSCTIANRYKISMTFNYDH